MFPQIEGLLVDEGVSFADLKGTLLHFVRRFFGPKLGVRLRPSYFPFTEPSAEVDATCYLCAGTARPTGAPASSARAAAGSRSAAPAWSTRTCSRPSATTRSAVTGFAFGMGLSRMAMLKFEVNDLRSFYEHDMRFLAQFRMKVSFNWLRELVDLKPGVTADTVAEKLTLVGLEVEAIERRGRDVGGVVVAEVRGKRPHPGVREAVARPRRGRRREEEVVCGARNVPAPGGKVAWAPPGATLPGGADAGAARGPRRDVAGHVVQRGRAGHERAG